jgi:fatty-acyl-CoA synthase
VPVGIGGKDAYLDNCAASSRPRARWRPSASKTWRASWPTRRGVPAVRLHGGMSVLDALPEKPVDLRPLGPSDLCYIQFSSGSTRHPHGVQITQAALMANLAGITGPAGLEVVAGDRAASWLPLYHDMGLIGFLMAPLSTQLSLDYLTPRDFARRPTQWLNLISQQSRHHRLQPELRLRPRHAPRREPGAGRSRPVVLAPCRHRRRHDPPGRARPLCATFEGGLQPQSFIPSYGMAEVCLAITFSPARHRVRTHDTHGRPTTARRTRRFVLCGKVLPGIAWKCATSRQGVGDREVGRIFVAGPSIMPGYFGEPSLARGACGDGWLDTGDLGYTLDRRSGRHRARQGPDHRQRPQYLAAGHRMGDRDAPRRQERRFGGLLRRWPCEGANASSSAVLARVRRRRGARPWRATWRQRGARGDRRRLRRRAGAAVDGPADHRRRASSRARAPRPTTWPAFTTAPTTARRTRRRR